MKKKIIAIIASVLLLTQCAVLCTGCSGKEKQFGEFSYYGKKLIDYAVKDISSDELKNLVDLHINIGPANSAFGSDGNVSGVTQPPEPDQAIIKKLTTDYAVCEIDVKLYENESKDPKEYKYTLQGTDFYNIVETNKYRLNDQIIVRSLTMYPALVDYMDSENAKFHEESSPAPFKDIYTYHTAKKGNAVIKQRAYIEIPATQNGGVGCAYRQDIESVYDSEAKITKWQSSMGIYTTTPSGTTKQGYILEMDFTWKTKE